MENKGIIVQLAKPDRLFAKCYHDFLDCNLLNGEEKIMFLVLKRFLDIKSDNGNVFPTIETIQEMTGWGNQKITKYIDSLIKKGIIKKVRQGFTKPNIYILSDCPEMWICDNAEEIATITDNQDVKPITAEEHIAELERMGYQVELKRKELASDTEQSIETSTIQNHFTIDKDNTKETKSQAERYTMEDIKALYEYDSLTIQYQAKQTDIDIVFDILYETLNNTKKTTRIGGEYKPTMVVIGKLMKLRPGDLIYSIDKYHEQTERIKNAKSYLLTILYNSREQNHLDLMNLGHHNGDF